MTTLNGTKNISLSERPKLYTQMINEPYVLSKLNPDTLFNYLQAEKKIAKITFFHISEFLNIFNVIILYYIISYYNIKNKTIDLIILLGIDCIFIFFAFSYYFLVKNKQNKQNTRIILIFSVVGLFISELINILCYKETSKIYFLKIHKYIKLNYIIFSIIFLTAYDYYTNPASTSSIPTKILYLSFPTIMSSLTWRFDIKIRLFICGINFFEFIPEIRKLVSSYSNKQNVLCYIINFCWVELYLFYLHKYLYFLRLLVANIVFIIFYPMFFNYLYKKEKILIKGLWDLPQVTSYY